MGPHNKDKDYSRLGVYTGVAQLREFTELSPYTCEVVFPAQQRRIACRIPSFIKPDSLNPTVQILIPTVDTKNPA